MQWIINLYPTIVSFIGVLDAVIILIMGIVSAGLWLTNYKADAFWERIWPATGVLIGTSVGAGIVFTITRYVASWAAQLTVAGLIVVLAFGDAAFAQSATAVDVGGAWNAFQTWTITIVTVAVSALVGWLLLLLKQKTGLSIDDSMRDALQTALTNAAGLVLNRLGNQLQGKTIDVHNELVAEALNYVLKAAPAAIAHFGLTPDLLRQKIVAKLPQIANTAAMPNA